MRNLDIHPSGFGSVTWGRKSSNFFGRVVAVVAETIRRWVHALHTDWENRAGLAALETLDNRMLDDMGLSRDDIDAALRQSDPRNGIDLLKARRRGRISRYARML